MPGFGESKKEALGSLGLNSWLLDTGLLNAELLDTELLDAELLNVETRDLESLGSLTLKLETKLETWNIAMLYTETSSTWKQYRASWDS